MQVGVLVDPAQRRPRLVLEVPHELRSPVQRSYSSSNTTYSGVASAAP